MFKDIVVGICGLHLTDSERNLLRIERPLGVILFARNIESLDQVRDLILDIKYHLNHDMPLILIDQEGGGKQANRLIKKVIRETLYPACNFAKIIQSNPSLALKAISLQNSIIGIYLNALGINVNCSPVCDLMHPHTTKILTDRIFGNTVDQVVDSASCVADVMLGHGVFPVIKHIPGHGSSAVDTHIDLSVVERSLADLETDDFLIFKRMASCAPFAMSAHIIYKCLDSENPATLSSKVISYVRNSIGFNGILFSDAIEMKALKSSVEVSATRAYDAGIDVVLHCTGVLEETQSIMKIARTSDSNGNLYNKLQNAQNSLKKCNEGLNKVEEYSILLNEIMQY